MIEIAAGIILAVLILANFRAIFRFAIGAGAVLIVFGTIFFAFATAG